MFKVERQLNDQWIPMVHWVLQPNGCLENLDSWTNLDEACVYCTAASDVFNINCRVIETSFETDDHLILYECFGRSIQVKPCAKFNWQQDGF
jgi:hypothetical protein